MSITDPDYIIEVRTTRSGHVVATVVDQYGHRTLGRLCWTARGACRSAIRAYRRHTCAY